MEIAESPASAASTVAAIDLGSNSFHMIVARVVDGRMQIVDRLRERVQLAAGLDGEGDLDPAKRAEALACLSRIGERVRGMPRGCVRAVGTNTFRRTRDARLLFEAERALGRPIEIVSGAEEARLVYLGVAHAVSSAGGRRLVVDIGGGSTECIVGEGFEPIVADSLELGCVTFSMRFFADGALRNRAFSRAELAASLEFERVRNHYQSKGWEEAIGSSGTIRAIDAILRQNEISNEGITLPALEALRDAMVSARDMEAVELDGLEEDRRRVLPGGLAILLAAFRSLGIERMTVTRGALREGVLYDLLGRIQHEDRREQTIATFQQRFQVDVAHAARVEATALSLLEQVRDAWALPDEESARFLSWAARLHEVGIWISFSRHHRHGAYILENADMAGFSRPDQDLLAALVREHRRKIVPNAFAHLHDDRGHLGIRLGVLLRLAVRLARSRREEPLPAESSLRADGDALVLRFPEGWLEQRPLLSADLEREAERLPAVGLTLEFS